MIIRWLHSRSKYWHPILWVPDTSRLYRWLMGYSWCCDGRRWGIEWRHLIIAWGKEVDNA